MSLQHLRKNPLLVILLLAAAMRLWGLQTMPPGLQFDEAHNAIDALRLLEGEAASPWFFTDNGGREPLVTWLHAGLLALVGEDRPQLALRLVSALAGLLTIYFVNKMVGAVFEDRRLGWMAAGFLAFSFWHLHFSRYGIRAILAPLWSTAAVYYWWRALGGGDRLSLPGLLNRGPRAARPAEGDDLAAGTVEAGPDPDPKPRAWLLDALRCGLCLAGAVYSHPSGRLLPFVLVGHAISRTIFERGRRETLRQTWTSLIAAGLTSFVVFLPLGRWFLAHPEWFTGHPSDVSVFAVAARDHGGDLAAAMWAQTLAVAGMFFIAGDPSTFHNLPGLPVYDPLSALLALMGLGIAFGALLGPHRSARDRATLFAIWFGVMLLPTWLSDRPPNYSRAIAALPVVALFPALGLRWLVAALDIRRAAASPDREGLSARTQMLLICGALAVAGLRTSYRYFQTFAQDTPHIYHSYDVEKREAYEWLKAQAETAEVFLHPLWAEHASFAYLNRDGPVRTLDATETLVLPGGDLPPVGRFEEPAGRRVVEGESVFAFPAKEAEREGWAEMHASAFPFTEREDIHDALDRPLLTVFRVRDWEIFAGLRADFGEAIGIEGYRVERRPRPGEPLPITFQWRCNQPMDRDWTLFVHLLGPEGEPWGQLDRQPAKGSYPTSRWRPGDLIIDRYSPVLAEDARLTSEDINEDLRVEIGWYDVASGERLPTLEGTSLRLPDLSPAAEQGTD